MPKMLACRWLCCVFLRMKRKGNSYWIRLRRKASEIMKQNYYLSCCVIDQKKNFFMLCFWFDGLMIVWWMMAIKFPYLIFFWSLNSYNPELILISDYDPELFLYFLASLQCNLRLVLSKLFHVIAGQNFSWSSLLFHPVNFTSSLHLAITFWLIIFSLVFFLSIKVPHETPTIWLMDYN